MKEPDCPRLARELAALSRMSRTTSRTRKRWIRDHARWCTCNPDNTWRPPTGLARDPDER